MDKKDYIWLERHTEINNICTDIADCAFTDLAIKIHRPHHLKRLRQIFSEYPQELFRDNDELLYIRVKGLKIEDFYNIALSHNAEIIFNDTDNKIYYIPADRKKYLRIFRRSSAKMLSNLSNRKKLDILFALHQEVYPNNATADQNLAFLDQNSDKLLALLQMKLPRKFLEDEKRKTRLVAAEIAKIPHIAEKINGFRRLKSAEQQNLLTEISYITADINNIPKPEILFLTTKQMNESAPDTDWIDTNAYTSGHTIYIDKQKTKQENGIYSVLSPFHETLHVAQAYGDYSAYPDVEDMFSAKLMYIEGMPETYSFAPPELVTYTLEHYLQEELINRLPLRTPENMETPEYDIARQYVQKALQRSY